MQALGELRFIKAHVQTVDSLTYTYATTFEPNCSFFLYRQYLPDALCVLRLVYEQSRFPAGELEVLYNPRLGQNSARLLHNTSQ